MISLKLLETIQTELLLISDPCSTERELSPKPVMTICLQRPYLIGTPFHEIFTQRTLNSGHIFHLPVRGHYRIFQAVAPRAEPPPITGSAEEIKSRPGLGFLTRLLDPRTICLLYFLYLNGPLQCTGTKLISWL